MRSGLAEAAAPERLYVATAAAGDAEMAARVARHKASRTRLDDAGGAAGACWRARAACTPGLHRTHRLPDPVAQQSDVGRPRSRRPRSLAWPEAIRSLGGPAVFVSNEVGMGIVPEHKLGRDFRDWQGNANQAAARACDTVVWVAAGLPVLLKPGPRPIGAPGLKEIAFFHENRWQLRPGLD